MFRLLPRQQSILNFEKLNPHTSVHHSAIAIQINGPLDETKFLKAWELLIQKHPVLHSKLNNQNKEAFLEKIPQTLSTPIEIFRMPGETPPLSELTTTLDNIQKQAILHEPFDLENNLLWRSLLLQYAKNQYQFLFVFHQLLMDKSVVNNLLGELSEIYNTLLQEQTPDLEMTSPNLLAIPKDMEESAKIQFWKNTLQDLTVLKIHPDYPPQKAFRYHGDQIDFTIPSELLTGLKKIAARYNESLQNVLLATLFSLLYRYTSENDICLGMSVNSGNKEVADSVTQQIIPLRLAIDKDQSFVQLLQRVGLQLKSNLQNQLPFETIATEALDLHEDNIITPINVLVEFNNHPKKFNLLHTQCTIPIELNLGHSQFENFSLHFSQMDSESCTGHIRFNTDLFKRTSMLRLIEHLGMFCEQVVANPECIIREMNNLTQQEASWLDRFHQQNKKITPRNEFFHSIFKDVAKRHPQRRAVIFHPYEKPPVEMTYAELDNITDKVAALLQNIGIGPEKTVGICLNRSLNMFIALIAVMKAGGVAVPMESNPELPLTNDSPLYQKIIDPLVNIVLVDNQTEALLNDFKNSHKSFFTLNLDDRIAYLKTNKELDLHYKPPKLSPNNLAYIMYTSGTTGKPKGVMIEHAGLTNLAYALKDRKTPLHSKFLCNSPLTFDPIILEILACLTAEGEIHLINEKERLSPAVQERIIHDYEINWVTLLPDIIKNLNPAHLPSLQDVTSMGAMPHQETLELWHRLLVIIRNEYGPTETTICATENPYQPSRTYTNIGVPIRNVYMTILDENGQECPPSVPGQLYIGGIGVARGYVGNNLLSEEKFPTLFYLPQKHAFVATCPNSANAPLGKRKHDVIDKKQSNPEPMRLYATGDFANYEVDENGNISINFLGRKDRRIKMHGVSIEIDGVEAILRNHPNIKDVYLLANSTHDILTVYLVSKNHEIITKQDLDDFLKTTALPTIAWPSVVVPLTELPITKNGKINTKALPSAQLTDFRGPETPFQKQLCQIWSEVLHLDSIDIQKTFRQHGGDSYALGSLEMKLNRELKLTAHIGINFLHKEINILKLEEILREKFLPQPQTATLNIPGTMFYPERSHFVLKPSTVEIPSFFELGKNQF